MSTFIHGIASAQCLDKSGEIVEIAGLDITSLAKTGTINFEHNMGKDAQGKSIQINIPAQVVGKILKAKKIFSKIDCADEHETHFWNKAKVPFVYMIAELLDDYCDSARECAGKFKYSQANPTLEGIFGFSVEGSEIPNTRRGMLITRSIARKVTLTCAPCNAQCIAEILDNHKSQIKDDFEEIFKTEENAITLFKSGEGVKIYEQYMAKKENEPEAPKPAKTPANQSRNKGIKIGTTKSGKHVYSHGHVGAYNFNPAEHKEAGEHHRRAAVMATNPKLADNHIERMKAHNNAALSGGRQLNNFAPSLKHRSHTEQATGKGLAKSEPQGWSKGKVANGAVHFSHPEHGVVSIHKQPGGDFHVKHHGAMAGIGGVKGAFGNAKAAGAHANKYMTGINQKKILPARPQNHTSPAMMGKNEADLNKALEAGNTNAAPSTLTNGAAYQSENMAKKATNVTTEGGNFQGTKKQDWNKRAKSDYDAWPHKQRFESFMQARMPHLAAGEIQAIGRALALKKSIDFEKSLEAMFKAEPLKKVLKSP